MQKIIYAPNTRKLDKDKYKDLHHRHRVNNALLKSFINSLCGRKICSGDFDNRLLDKKKGEVEFLIQFWVLDLEFKNQDWDLSF